MFASGQNLPKFEYSGNGWNFEMMVQITAINKVI